MSSSGSPVLPLAWTDILDNILQSLAQTEAEAARAEEALAAPLAPLPEPASPVSDEVVARLQRLQACVAQAEQTAAQVEASVQLSTDLLQRWLAAAEAVRGKLANEASAPLS